MLKQKKNPQNTTNRLDLINLRTLKKIANFMEVQDIIELSLTNKNLNEKLEKIPEIKIRVLTHNYKKTKEKLEVSPKIKNRNLFQIQNAIKT